MKITIDKALEMEFDPWSLDKAGTIIQEAKRRHKNGADDILRAMLTLLLFGQIEQQSPGTLNRMLSDATRIAETLKGPQPEKQND